MKKTLLSIAAVFVLSASAQAQLVEVQSVEQVKLPAEMRVSMASISPDGSYAVVSPLTGGLQRLDLNTGAVSAISATASPLLVSFSADGNTVLFRESSYKNNLRMTTLNAYDATTGAVKAVVPATRQLQGYMVEGAMVKAIVGGRQKAVALNKDVQPVKAVRPVLSIDRGHLCITRDGNTVILDPLGIDCNSYLWPSLSPDGKHITFFGVGKGAYTCNLDGSDLHSLGMLRAVNWLDDNTLVGMDDVTDEYTTVKSSIVAVSADGSVRQVLTGDDVVATFPTAATGKVTFTTPTGQMYIINLK